MNSLKDKICIVTGASRGIGEAIVRRLVREGATVYGVARDRARLEALAATEDRIHARVCDVAQEDTVNATVRGIVDAEGRVDVLVNNAGIATFCPLEETDYDDFMRVMTVNVGGVFLFSKAVLPAMRRQGSGEIINISSVVGVKGYPLQTVYGASKHAVLGLTKALAAEVQAESIRVRSISPGAVDTDLGKQARSSVDASELMRPEDIAELVAFMLTFSPSAVVDNINVRRRGSTPWF